MFTVAVIGVGQIGSRHLQGLSKMNQPVRLELVEPNGKAMDVAKARFGEVAAAPGIHGTSWFENIEQLSDTLDLVIVATNSDIRAAVVKKLLGLKKVKYMILEKVLFQKISDYEEIHAILEAGQVRAWVNHPRRLFSFYQPFMEKLQSSARISYHVQGGQWNLCSNALHYLDHLMSLTGQSRPTLDINPAYLNPYYDVAKRESCVEIGGTLCGALGNATFSIDCNSTAASAPLISIASDKVKLIIDEAKGWARYAYADEGWVWQEYQGKISFMQSELSGQMADEVLQSGVCGLPSYADAAYLHVGFLAALQAHFEIIEKQPLQSCRIS